MDCSELVPRLGPSTNNLEVTARRKQEIRDSPFQIPNTPFITFLPNQSEMNLNSLSHRRRAERTRINSGALTTRAHMLARKKQHRAFLGRTRNTDTKSFDASKAFCQSIGNELRSSQETLMCTLQRDSLFLCQLNSQLS